MTLDELGQELISINDKLREMNAIISSDEFLKSEEFGEKYYDMNDEMTSLESRRKDIIEEISRLKEEAKKAELKEEREKASLFDKKKRYESERDYFEEVKSYVVRTSAKRIKKCQEKDFLTYLFNIKSLAYKVIFKPNIGSYNQFYMKHPVTQIYEPLTINNLGSFIDLITEYLPESQKPNKSFTVLQKELNAILKTKTNLSHYGVAVYNPHPKHLLLYENGVLDSKTKVFYYNNSNEYEEIMEQYHFTTYKSYDYKRLDEVNPMYVKLYNDFLDGLSNGNADKKNVFKQLARAAMEGKGRYKYAILQGNAGSGKTTFGLLLQMLANPELVVNFNFTHFNDHNMLNQLSENTALVYGDDLQKNAKLLNEGLSNFKIVVNGQEISVKIKYENNRDIRCEGVFLQMTNEPVSIYEFNESIQDRLFIINIDGKNYRNENDEDTLVRKELLNRCIPKNKRLTEISVEFLQAVTADTIETVDYFEEYSLTEEMKEDTLQVINDANWAEGFVRWLDENGILSFNKLPLSHVKDMVNHYFMTDNRGGKLPNSKNITKDLEPVLKKKGFILSEKIFRLHTVSKLEYNNDLIKKELLQGIKVNNVFKTPMFINADNEITEENVEAFKKIYQTKTLKDLEIEEMIIANYLADDLKTTIGMEVASHFDIV